VNGSLTNQSVKYWPVTGRRGSDPREYFGVPFAIRFPSRTSRDVFLGKRHCSFYYWVLAETFGDEAEELCA
jgi:hypothetical protein